jgi:hypothetical protein
MPLAMTAMSKTTHVTIVVRIRRPLSAEFEALLDMDFGFFCGLFEVFASGLFSEVVWEV